MPTLSEAFALSRATRVYVVGAVAVSIALLVFGWFVARPAEDTLPTILYLAVGTQIAALLPIRWRHRVQTVPEPLLIATGLAAPGVGAGIVACPATCDSRTTG